MARPGMIAMPFETSSAWQRRTVMWMIGGARIRSPGQVRFVREAPGCPLPDVRVDPSMLDEEPGPRRDARGRPRSVRRAAQVYGRPGGPGRGQGQPGAEMEMREGAAG